MLERGCKARSNISLPELLWDSVHFSVTSPSEFHSSGQFEVGTFVRREHYRFCLGFAEGFEEGQCGPCAPPWRPAATGQAGSPSCAAGLQNTWGSSWACTYESWQFCMHENSFTVLLASLCSIKQEKFHTEKQAVLRSTWCKAKASCWPSSGSDCGHGALSVGGAEQNAGQALPRWHQELPGRWNSWIAANLHWCCSTCKTLLMLLRLVPCLTLHPSREDTQAAAHPTVVPPIPGEEASPWATTNSCVHLKSHVHAAKVTWRLQELVSGFQCTWQLHKTLKGWNLICTWWRSQYLSLCRDLCELGYAGWALEHFTVQL